MLIRKLSSGILIPAEYQFGGDIGCTYAITFISKIFNLELSDSIFVFYAFFITISLIVASVGMCCFTKSYKTRFFSFMSILLLAYVSWSIGDEYTISFCAAAYVPLILYIFEKKDKNMTASICFLVGILVVIFNFFRIHTGTLLALVVCACIGMSAYNKKVKILLLSLFCFGYFGMQYFIKSLFIQRNEYLKAHGYYASSQGHKHTFWHNVYPGFGFIENDKNLYFSDNCSAYKVKTINPSTVYLSKDYDHILKHEVFKLILYSPHFVLRVVFAKLGVLFYYFILCLLPAFWALFLPYMPLRIHIPYWIAMLWGALPGLLTIPNVLYLLGFIATAWLYGLHLIIYALNMNNFYFYMRTTKLFFVQLFHKVRLMEL